MHLEPKLLPDGWFNHANKLALNLLWRGKREALLVFLLLPSLIFFLPLTSMKAAAYIFCLFTFVCFCVKYDTHQNKSWFEVLGETKRHPQPILSVLILLIYITGFTDWNQSDMFEYDNAIDMLLALPFMSFTIFIIYMISSLLAVLLTSIGAILFFGLLLIYLKVKYKEKYSRKLEELICRTNMKSKLPEFNTLSLFGHFIVFHTNLNWGEAVAMSKSFTAKQHFTTPIIISTVIAAGICTLPLWFYSFPFLYAVYKISFWNGELEQRQLKKASSLNQECAQSPSKS